MASFVAYNCLVSRLDEEQKQCSILFWKWKKAWNATAKVPSDTAEDNTDKALSASTVMILLSGLGQIGCFLLIASLGILLSLDGKMTLGQEQGMLDVVSSYCFARQLSFKVTRSKLMKP